MARVQRYTSEGRVGCRTVLAEGVLNRGLFECRFRENIACALISEWRASSAAEANNRVQRQCEACGFP